MSVTLTGTGGWATRIGRWGGLLNNLNGILGTAAPSPGSAWVSGGPTISCLQDNITNINAQYASNDQQIVNGLWDLRDSTRGVFSGSKSTIRIQILASTIAQVDRDVLLPSKDPTSAMAELIRQVTNSSDNVAKPTITIAPGAGVPTATGTPVLAGSVVGVNGVQMDYIYNETIDVVVTNDSYTGGATAGQEKLSASGDAAQTDMLAFDWPKGSGASQALNAVDATADAGTNLLTNGGFDLFTVANTPDSWTIATGAAGTNVFSSTDIYGPGAKSLKFTGDAGLTITTVYQTLTLAANTVYALNAFVHVDAAAPAAGTLIFELTDTTNAVLLDAAGTACRYTVDLTQTTLQTTYVATGAMTTTQLNGAAVAGGAGTIFFRTGPTLSATANNVRLRVKFGTAITNTKSVFIDHMALCKATSLYTGGPYAAMFSGATKLVLNDRFKFTVANNYGSKFQNLLWRTFNMPGIGLQMPSSGSGTMADTLVA